MAPSYSGVWKLSTQYQYASVWPVDVNLLLAAGKALFFGGQESGTSKTEIDKINMASTGNATDFGDLAVISGFGSASASSVKAVVHVGLSTSDNRSDTITTVNIDSTGNATDFGNLSNARNNTAAGGSNTIMVISGGES